MSVATDHNLGLVWKHEGGSAQWMLRREQLAWLTPDQRCRAERLRQAKMLFGGAHRAYFLEEGRSAFQFPELAAGLPKFYRPLNLMTLVSRKTADLLFGESCRISIEDKRLQAIVDTVVDQSWLNATLLAAAMECSWAGDAFLEVVRVGGTTRIGQCLTGSADAVRPHSTGTGPDRATLTLGTRARNDLDPTYFCDCGDCKNHARAMVAAKEPDLTNAASYVSSVAGYHNAVNEKLGRRVWSLEEAIEHWSNELSLSSPPGGEA